MLPSISPLDSDFDRAACRFFREYNGNPPAVSLNDFLAQFERAIVFQTLVEMNGCQRRAAKFLKLKDTTLNRKVKVQHIQFIKTPI
jgi:DNA-binding protein Fis